SFPNLLLCAKIKIIHSRGSILESSPDLSLYFSALRFAADRHSNQRRKGTESAPFVNHLIEVSYLLWKVGGIRDPQILAAGVLHDVIEDTPTQPTEVAERFGSAVLNLVQEVSDDKSLPKQVRKDLQIEHALTLSADARPIKLADKIANVMDVVQAPPQGWSLTRIREYIDWSERVVNQIRGSNPALEACFDQKVIEARQRLQTLHD
ncbi:MAG: HD domain-containing protein, partial [Anaerolineaceae bacterium]